MKRPCRIASLGVDLVEFEKARAFYGEHRGRLAAILSPRERAYVTRGSRPERALAELLAAKEAAFKALGLPWMGLAGFRRISLRSRTPRRAMFRAGSRDVRVTFLSRRRFVVACAKAL